MELVPESSRQLLEEAVDTLYSFQTVSVCTHHWDAFEDQNSTLDNLVHSCHSLLPQKKRIVCEDEDLSTAYYIIYKQSSMIGKSKPFFLCNNY